MVAERTVEQEQAALVAEKPASWSAAEAAFGLLGRAVIVLDEQYRVLWASRFLDQLSCPGGAGRALGRPVAEVLGGALFDPEGSLRRSLDAGDREEGRRAFLHCRYAGARLVSVSAAAVDDAARASLGLPPEARTLVVLRPVKERTQAAASEFLPESELVARSPAMLAVVRLIESMHRSDATVLIMGESGAGKEVVAKAIHAHSPRCDGPFVAVNCAALPAGLLESELFGHVRGAFTGAHRDRAGRFEAAGQGTLFLDEVGDLPIELQPKLLRVLQERRYEAVGETRSRSFDARVIAATNTDLERAVESGRFREDLYYRLRVVPVHVPPLRERPEDVETLARYLLGRAGDRLGRALELSPDVSEALRNYDWPGNIRELENALEYAAAVAAGHTVHLEDLPSDLQPRLRTVGAGGAGRGAAGPTSDPPPAASPAGVAAGCCEPPEPEEAGDDADRILAVLERYRWRRGDAARALGMSRTTLWRRMRNLGLE